MGSRTFDGVRFRAWSNDHEPPHVHGFYAEVEVVIELDREKRIAKVAEREKNPRPRNAKRSDVTHAVRSAVRHFDELVKLWEQA